MKKLLRFFFSPNYYMDRLDDGCGCIFLFLIGIALAIAGIFYLINH
ncbi:hypothetical protein ACSFB8_01055 [Enterococcus faecalis]